jgi:hypothetical protein
MKSIRWIAASMFLGLLVAGCAVSTGGSESEPEQGDESVGEAQQAIRTYTITTYYSDSTHQVKVGTCNPLCSGGGVCTGIKTPYFLFSLGFCP